MIIDRTTRYSYRDEDGDELTVCRSAEGDGRVYFSLTSSGVVLPPTEFLKLLAGLYRAAGQEPPIVLPRPDVDQLVADGWIQRDRVVLQAPPDLRALTPAEARAFAASYAAAADLAEGEPKPADVARLAELIADVVNPAGLNAAAPWTPEQAAWAILRAGYRREATADE